MRWQIEVFPHRSQYHSAVVKAGHIAARTWGMAWFRLVPAKRSFSLTDAYQAGIPPFNGE